MARRPATTRKAGARKAAAPTSRSARSTKRTSASTRKTSTTQRKAAARTARKPAAPKAPLFAAVKGAERRNIGHVQLEVGRAGAARVKRMIYPPGFHWAVDMKPVTGTDLCMHAHVGFLAHGEIHIEYADGCIVEFKAPQIVEIAPGHDGWVVGKEPVVLIEIDFERDTAATLGLIEHSH
ncbi:MAG: hypothetical protein QM736_09705 [Vicinamibacterales bacterium]